MAMQLNMEPRPVLAVCLNPAWQKTLIFNHLQAGEVNRARRVHECGGGKGVNVARVFRRLGLPVAVAAFTGGYPGQRLRGEFSELGVEPILVDVAATTRCCFTVISEDNSVVTELIEPSGSISGAEAETLQMRINGQIRRFGAVALSGTVPPGISGEFYASVAREAALHGVPVLLDAVKDIAATLETGVTMLKINAAELRELAGAEDIAGNAQRLFRRFAALSWLAVTDGPRPARLFSREHSWRFTLPALPRVVSAIGGGDCTAAILCRRLAEKPDADGERMANFYAEALACASASCLTDTPSVFDPAEALKIRAAISID
ncbi:MAG: 1-phosphofructokinase family hexose kinase [Lentisphaeria bacterium]